MTLMCAGRGPFTAEVWAFRKGHIKVSKALIQAAHLVPALYGTIPPAF